MNLVAKEFVAARDDEQGVLLLSQFTGAARDLAEALIVNPYDIEQSAAAMHLALTMSPEEQRARMRSMRNLVQEFNVYRWAGRMLLDAARMRHRGRVMARARAARRRAAHSLRNAACRSPQRNWAFFLDFDGTLIDIAATPEAVDATPAEIALLAGFLRLAGRRRADQRRSIARMDELFKPLVLLPAAGQHGAERRDAQGRRHRYRFPDALRPGRWRHPQLRRPHRGSCSKTRARASRCTTGWRRARRRRLRGMREAAEPLGDAVEVQGGKMVVELKPAGCDKGRAIEAFMQEPPFAGRVPVFLGDDVTDEYGFRVVNRLGGHSVVGEGGARRAGAWRTRATRMARRLAGEMRLGVDVGGTKIAVAVLDANGAERLRRRVFYTRREYDAALALLLETIKAAETDAGERCTIGVGMPGLVDPETGVVENAYNTPFNKEALKRDLETLREVRFANDANCFALSEAVDGAARGARVVFGAILGTGVGGGVVVGERMSKAATASPANGATPRCHG